MCFDSACAEANHSGALEKAVMDSQVFGVRPFPKTSSLLASSVGLGWSSLAAELRSHGACEAPTIVPPHVELILIVAGNPDALVRRTGIGLCQEATPRTGAIWTSPAGAGKAATITKPVPQALHLHLPVSLFDRLRDDFNLPASPAYSIQHAAVSEDGVIDQLGRAILSELTAETSANRVFVETAALMLAARLVQNYSDCAAGAAAEPTSDGLDPVRLRRVLDHIADNLSGEITLGALAAIAGYSAYHFARKFAVSTGVSPGRYISQKRLEVAMSELSAGTLPLAEIALNAQFSSQASFTRAFHRVTGTTPNEFRRQRRR